MPDAPPVLPPPPEGEAAFKRLAPLLAAQPHRTDRLPSLLIDRFAADIKTHHDALQGQRSRFLVELGQHAQERFEERLGLLMDAARATSFVYAQHSIQITTHSTFRQLVTEAEPLHGIAIRGLNGLESGGAVSADQARAIRRGRGWADKVSDFQVLAPLLRAHFDALEPLQALQPDPELRLTHERIDRMASLAIELVEADRKEANPTAGKNWRGDLLACWALLIDTWDWLHIVAAGGYALIDDLDRARQGYPSLYQLQRRA